MIYPERHRLLPKKYIKFLTILFIFTIYLYIAAFHVSFPQNQGLVKTFIYQSGCAVKDITAHPDFMQIISLLFSLSQ